MAASEKTDRTAAESAGPGSGQAPQGSKAPPGPPASQPSEPSQLSDERFDDLLTRLRSVVDKLEGGNLSLEDSLKFFEEGIDLCRRGATILDSAERKVEVLLGGGTGGGATRTAPFEAPGGDGD